MAGEYLEFNLDRLRNPCCRTVQRCSVGRMRAVTALLLKR
jgi:hypothetical protein